jgi:hypothetical protein
VSIRNKIHLAEHDILTFRQTADLKLTSPARHRPAAPEIDPPAGALDGSMFPA